jgi:PhnB protein
MTDSTNYIPAGSHAITPYLCCRGAAEAIEFYVAVFGAAEVGERFVDAEGKVGHAELRFGDSVVMLADEYPGYGMSPVDLPDAPVSINLYVPDVDAVVERALERGAKVTTPLEETFYGVRRASLRDPFGHRWIVGTQVREVTAEDYEKAREDFSRTTAS